MANRYKISDLLPIGRENAITTEELLKVTRFKSVRELRKAIERERNSGEVICSGSGNGYWKPRDKQEVRVFCRYMENKATNTLRACRSAKELLARLDGQQKLQFDEGGTDGE